jgi:hypothetical protein
MLTLTGKNKFVTMANRRSLKELKATCDPCWGLSLYMYLCQERGSFLLIRQSFTKGSVLCSYHFILLPICSFSFVKTLCLSW